LNNREVVRLSELLGPSFVELWSRIKTNLPDELWCMGGRGSLKSSFHSIITLLLLSMDPLAHAFIGRRYDNELRDSVFGQMQWAAYHLKVDHIWRFMTSPMQAINESTGQKILFRGVDNPLKAKSINLGKGYIKVAWFEEVDQYGSMDEVRSILQSIFRGEDVGHRIALFSFNPPKSMRSWVNQEVAVKQEGRVVHTSDYRTVPPEWLGKRFLADAERLKKTNEVAYEHEYLGIPTGTGNEIFNNVTLRPITDAERLAFPTYYQGLDFGFATDPLCFGRMYYDPKRRRLFIFEEIQGVGLLNRAFAEKATLDHKRHLTMADSEAPKDIVELRVEHGFNIRGADKPKGSVEHGIKWLQELAEIIIDPNSCPLAAYEYVNYAYEKTRDGHIIARYPDKNNHSIDMTRYAMESFILVKQATEPTIVRPPRPVAHAWR